ncbi:response regulator transcription factor [Psychromarinibacter sp. S121]|uniref:response regulator transcription factor n=1 Tax=Psychromarinibacter sp. S121 TaxID=3415127 RepID=UPI003C7BEAEC
MKILVVDDDPRLREIVSISLERGGYGVVAAADGQSALTHTAREQPALVVLDVGLPDMDGFEVCRAIRTRSDVPILFLTALDDEVDRILGLELGADDYVTKPFSPRELLARIRAILKRTAGPSRNRVLRHRDIALDPAAHHCSVGQVEVRLTGMELSILEALMRAPETVHTRPRLVEGVWGAGTQVSDRTLDSHIRNIRQKLVDAGCDDAIETVHGVGVRMGRARA